MGTRPILRPLLRRAGDLLAPDDPEAAAILHGAGEGGFPSPHTEEDHRKAVASLDTSLGAAQRKKLNERGQRMDEDAAISFALDAIRRLVGTDDNVTTTHPPPESHLR
jgi:hypothetical protein